MTRFLVFVGFPLDNIFCGFLKNISPKKTSFENPRQYDNFKEYDQAKRANSVNKKRHTTGIDNHEDALYAPIEVKKLFLMGKLN